MVFFPRLMKSIPILIDGKMQSDLSAWKQCEKIAQRVLDQGDRIYWEIDLGLFDKLSFPLEDSSQFLSLCLSLEHFRDTLWKQFGEHSQGICLYKGSADYSPTFLWNEIQASSLREWIQEGFKDELFFSRETGIQIHSFSEVEYELLEKNEQGRKLLSLFCRDVCAGYLNLLAARLPDAISCFIEVDGKGIEDPVLLAQLLNKESYPKINLLVSNGLGSEHGTHGICLPSLSIRNQNEYQGLQDVFDYLHQQKIAYRLIPEMLLITEWDGLDSLFVLSKSLTPQGRRKLLGFCAAGGQVVSIGESLQLPEEINFIDLQKNL